MSKIINLNKIKAKASQNIHYLRSQPYQKRMAILRGSLIVIICFLLVGWVFMVKNNVAEHPVTSTTQATEKTEEPSHLTIFRNGLNVIYRDYLRPFLSAIGGGLLKVFSQFVGLVIQITQSISSGVHQLVIQYKSYAELILSLMK